jgi:uncharacterized protein YecT (DUF1311 family)
MLSLRRGSPAMAVCLWLLLGSPANATSFACAKARTLQEKLICSDDGLGVLDDQLAQTYKQSLAGSADNASEKRSQMRWLVDVRDKCVSADCLRKVYTARLSALKSQAAAGSSCSVQEASLVGAWVRRSGPGFFEEMAFGTDGTQRTFDSWLHHRPEISGGSWTLKDCTIYIQHASEAQLSLAFKVSGLRNGQLYVAEDGDKEVSIYKRVGK